MNKKIIVTLLTLSLLTGVMACGKQPNTSSVVPTEKVENNTPTPTTALVTPTEETKPTPTEEIKPTDTVTPTPTEVVEPTVAPVTPTELPQTPTVEPTVTPTNTVAPTPTNTPTVIPTATNTPVPTATNTPKPTSTPTNTPLPTNTPTPTNTGTPTPTNTPTATPTPEGCQHNNYVEAPYDESEKEQYESWVNAESWAKSLHLLGATGLHYVCTKISGFEYMVNIYGDNGVIAPCDIPFIGNWRLVIPTDMFVYPTHLARYYCNDCGEYFEKCMHMYHRYFCGYERDGSFSAHVTCRYCGENIPESQWYYTLEELEAIE